MAKSIVNLSPITIRSSEHLGGTIRRIRKLSGLSQGELAKKAGITQATVSNIERNKTSADMGTVLLIFSALSLDIVVAPRPKATSGNKESLKGLF